MCKNANELILTDKCVGGWVDTKSIKTCPKVSMKC